MSREDDLAQLVQRLRSAAEANLTSVVLYGSGVDDEFNEEHSDLNILCVVQSVDAGQLRKVQPVANWWWKRGHPVPLIFTLGELRDAADIFAIELLDMKRRHRTLFGEDLLPALDVPMGQHRLQVERELRISVVRLRQAFLKLRGRRDELSGLLIASSSTFAALFRHSLIALGESAPDLRRDGTEKLGRYLGLDVVAICAVYDLREGKERASAPDIEGLFARYLDEVARVAQEMDRRLAAQQT
jgi:hypothetical protein